MSCSDFEQQIALYVGEDLSAVERGRVEAHLKECSTCWDLAEDLKESQAVFKSIRQDVPDAAALSALHERVLSGVSGIESMTWFERVIFGGWRRKAALASVALIVAGSGALWLARSPRATPTIPTAVTIDPAPAVVGPPIVSAPQAQPAPLPRPVQKRVPRPAPPAEEVRQAAIQFVTDDPNIIIYWLVDEKGE
jgi:hypothetical protein